MKADDDFNLTAAEALKLRADIASAQKWMAQWKRDQRKLAQLETQITRLTNTIDEMRARPKTAVAWIKAADAAVLGGGISTRTLARRRQKGQIPRHGWRQQNSRVIEYRADVILAQDWS